MADKNGVPQALRVPWTELTDIREARGLGIREFARVVKLRPGQVNDLEKGRREPTTAMYQRLTAELRVPLWSIRKGSKRRLEAA